MSEVELRSTTCTPTQGGGKRQRGFGHFTRPAFLSPGGLKFLQYFTTKEHVMDKEVQLVLTIIAFWVGLAVYYMVTT